MRKRPFSSPIHRVRLGAALLTANAFLLMTACSNPGSTPGPDAATSEAPQATESYEPSRLEPGTRQDPPSFYLGGIQINEADHNAWFLALKAQGMNMVQVTDYAKQGDWDTDHMWWDEEAPYVLQEIRGAKAHGLNVILVLRVALDHAFARNAFLWHGMIMPKNDAMLTSWFEQYGRFCKKWAEIAEREGVDVLMIGSEMNALASTLPVDEIPALEEYYLNEEKQARRREEILAQKQLIEDKNLYLQDRETFGTVEEYLDARIATERGWAGTLTDGESLEQVNIRRAKLQDHWVKLIRDLRTVYTGPLGFAANFDQYHEVGFWPELDFMGINAYFQLRTDVLDGVADEDREARLYPLLVQGWNGVLGKIASFREARHLDGKPLIFTEMGYTYRRQSSLEPWADTGFSMIYNPTTLPDGSPGEPEKHVVVWRDQPDDLTERALAVRALHEAHAALEKPFLHGISYWKLSSHDYHKEHESFMVHIGDGTDDPILPELRRFLGEGR